MRSSAFWIPGPWRGRLAIVSRPRGGDWLDSETRAWREAGFDMIVSLLEPREEIELRLDHEATSAIGSDLEFRSFPIPDGGIPRSHEAVAELVGRLVIALQAGTSIGVHCRQGIGRSAMIAAATLIASGEGAREAVETVSIARGLPVPETDAQQHWVAEFASWLESSRA